MRKRNNPTLFDWAIIRVSLQGNPEVARFHFTGIEFGHPRLQDFVQFVTTDIQEISEDRTWARTRSRVYNLERPLNRDEFTPELEAEIKDILQHEIGRTCDVEWISTECELAQKCDPIILAWTMS